MAPLPPNPPEPWRSAPSELSRLYLQLLRELADRVESSTQAVVSGDVARLEAGTAEQCRLWQKIVSLPPEPGHGADPAWPPEVVDAQQRLLHLGRVQRALLRRSQQCLRAVCNLLAGPHSGYAPMAGEAGVELHPAGKEG